jgi:4-oxalocrotonate tautomerase
MVSIKIAKGRSLDQKRELVSSVTQAIAKAVDVDPKKIWIHLDEFEPHNFATGGRLLGDKSV